MSSQDKLWEVVAAAFAATAPGGNTERLRKALAAVKDARLEDERPSVPAEQIRQPLTGVYGHTDLALDVLQKMSLVGTPLASVFEDIIKARTAATKIGTLCYNAEQEFRKGRTTPHFFSGEVPPHDPTDDHPLEWGLR